MSAMFGRQPPRFVPTLTDVVPDSKEPISTAAVVQEQSTGIDPDIQVVLTEASPHGPTPPKDGSPIQDMFEAQIMSHLDNVLPGRLETVVRRAIDRQAEKLYASLRPQIEEVVREAVNQAIRQEAVQGVSAKQAD